MLVRDLRDGASSSPRNLANVGGVLYFVANDGTHGFELWKSDGTADGTVLVTDLWPGPNDSNPTSLLDVDGALYFVANDGETGTELRKTDGTAAGTVLVKDINPAGDANVATLVYENETLYFVANDGAHGSELWRSDGTEAGTYLLKDITPGGADSNSTITDFTNVSGTLYFGVRSDWNKRLWNTDGTSGGTAPVLEELYYSGPAANLNGVLVFGGEDGLWRTDGTASGTWTISLKITPTGNGRGQWQPLHPAPLGTRWLRHLAVGRNHCGDHPPQTGILELSRPLFRHSGLTNIGGVLYYSSRDPVTGTDPWIVPLESQPAVLAEHVFYNNSYFDNYTPGPSEADNAAIAFDKASLLPISQCGHALKT